MMPDFHPAQDGRAPRATAEEEVLLLRVARQETAALEELHRGFSPRLFAVAVRMLGNEAEAADAVQDTLVRIWEKAPVYDPEQAAPFTWMFLLLRGICHDRLRKKGRAAARSGPLPVALEEWPDPGRDPAQCAHWGDVVRGVRQGIAALPHADRGLLESLLLGGCTVKSISESTGEAEGTLRVRFHRALQRLRQLCHHLHED